MFSTNNSAKFTNEKIRDAWIDFLEGQEFNVGLTLNFNVKGLDLSFAKERVRRLFFRVDRHLLGTRFHKQTEQRTRGVFFFEHPESNLHCHGLLRVDHARLGEFQHLFPGSRGPLWSAICPSGTYWLRDVQPRAAAAYVTKAQDFGAEADTMLWLQQCHPDRA